MADVDMAAAALEYAAIGWQVVILHNLTPSGCCTCGGDCGNGRGKHPRLPKWQDRATADPDVLRGLWGQHPRSNVGIRTGSGSGVVAIDVDPPSGEAFLAALADGDLPPTVEMVTGKGRRLLYAIPDGAEHEPRTVCFQDEAGDEAVRLQGGTSGAQFVAPPSAHYSGRRYEWAAGRSPFEVEPAPMPAWLLVEMCRPAQAPFAGARAARSLVQADRTSPGCLFA